MSNLITYNIYLDDDDSVPLNLKPFTSLEEARGWQNQIGHPFPDSHITDNLGREYHGNVVLHPQHTDNPYTKSALDYIWDVIFWVFNSCLEITAWLALTALIVFLLIVPLVVLDKNYYPGLLTALVEDRPTHTMFIVVTSAVASACAVLIRQRYPKSIRHIFDC
jgi:hypothetical protein